MQNPNWSLQPTSGLTGKRSSTSSLWSTKPSRIPPLSNTSWSYGVRLHDVSLSAPKEIDWHDWVKSEKAVCEAEPLDAEHPLYILYTSGTTGKPKGVVHVHGGYMVGTYITTKYVFDLKEDDVYFCVADPGWVTGHSYIVYGPLLNGATILTAEGKPDYPNPGRWWDLIERYGVSIFYTTPTAIRLLMRYGEDWPKKYDLSTLRILGSVGEPINPEAWEWFHRAAGGK